MSLPVLLCTVGLTLNSCLSTAACRRGTAAWARPGPSRSAAYQSRRRDLFCLSEWRDSPPCPSLPRRCCRNSHSTAWVPTRDPAAVSPPSAAPPLQLRTLSARLPPRRRRPRTPWAEPCVSIAKIGALLRSIRTPSRRRLDPTFAWAPAAVYTPAVPHLAGSLWS